MQLNRRSLLKFATLLPFVGPAIVKAAVKPKSETQPDSGPVKNKGVSNRGKFYLMLGRRGTGKTFLAGELSKRYGWIVLDGIDHYAWPVIEEMLLGEHTVIGILNLPFGSHSARNLADPGHIAAYQGNLMAQLIGYAKADWMFEVEACKIVGNDAREVYWNIRNCKRRSDTPQLFTLRLINRENGNSGDLLLETRA